MVVRLASREESPAHQGVAESARHRHRRAALSEFSASAKIVPLGLALNRAATTRTPHLALWDHLQTRTCTRSSRAAPRCQDATGLADIYHPDATRRRPDQNR